LKKLLQLKVEKTDKSVNTIAVMAWHDHRALEDNAKTGDN